MLSLRPPHTQNTLPAITELKSNKKNLIKENKLNTAQIFYSAFFDSKILKLEIQYSDENDNQSLKITTKKNRIKYVGIFENPSNLEIFETEFHNYYIGNCKCIILQNEQIYISLDPYDANEKIIDEKDNFKFYCKRILIEEEQTPN